MTEEIFDRISASLTRISSTRPVGKISAVKGSHVEIAGLNGHAKVGDTVQILGASQKGDIVSVCPTGVTAMMDGPTDGLSPGLHAALSRRTPFAPHNGWIGRVVDPDGLPLDGRPLLPACADVPLHAPPPAAADRRGLGARLSTGFAVFDTILPIVRGQRIGLFSGSGVGKSTLLSSLAKKVDADVIVIGLVGERGRELREFVENALGADGMARSVVIAATSDRPAKTRRACPMAATAVAEFFRDQGKQVLLLIDSITRFAEAHREIAVAAGEAASLRGHPATTPATIAGLCERAGPGLESQGDITAIYTVLVSGSDMEEPVADMLRGVLDGHIVLDRTIAERGRFPAIDVTRSVSRSLPQAANPAENKLISQARHLMGTYAQSELMIQSGLYVDGSDAKIDAAIATRDALEKFVANEGTQGIAGSYRLLQRALASDKSGP